LSSLKIKKLLGTEYFACIEEQHMVQVLEFLLSWQLPEEIKNTCWHFKRISSGKI
jgi:hypothetical protein